MMSPFLVSRFKMEYLETMISNVTLKILNKKCKTVSKINIKLFNELYFVLFCMFFCFGRRKMKNKKYMMTFPHIINKSINEIHFIQALTMFF
jgi:hypothetical protein